MFSILYEGVSCTSKLHMGQFLQDRNSGHFLSYFFSQKEEPSYDQKYVTFSVYCSVLHDANDDYDNFLTNLSIFN